MRRLSNLDRARAALPPEPTGQAAVYRCYTEWDRLLYVGCSVNPQARLFKHRYGAVWWPRVGRTTVEWFPTLAIAADAEKQAILTECPVYNSQGVTTRYIYPAATPRHFRHAVPLPFTGYRHADPA